MKLHTLLERRSNPDINTRSTTIQQLARYKDRNDVYISLTSVDKIGVNPQSKYNDTPIGVYTYNLRSVWSKLEKQGTAGLPLAGNQPYLWVLQSVSNNTLEVGAGNIPGYEQKIQHLYKNYLSHDWELAREIYEVKDQHKTFTQAVESVVRKQPKLFYEKSTIQTVNSAFDNQVQGAMLWYVTQIAAQGSGGKKSMIKWASILRELGFECVSDNTGKGIIHPNEPTQAVFLSSRGFKVLDKLLNKRVA